MRKTLHPACLPQLKQAHKYLNPWNSADVRACMATPSAANASLTALVGFVNGVKKTARQTEHAAIASAVRAMTSTSEQTTTTKGHRTVSNTVSSCAGLQLEALAWHHPVDDAPQQGLEGGGLALWSGAQV